MAKNNFGRRDIERGQDLWVLKEENGDIAIINGKKAKFRTRKVAEDKQRSQEKMFRPLSLGRLNILKGVKL